MRNSLLTSLVPTKSQFKQTRKRGWSLRCKPVILKVSALSSHLKAARVSFLRLTGKRNNCGGRWPRLREILRRLPDSKRRKSCSNLVAIKSEKLLFRPILKSVLRLKRNYTTPNPLLTKRMQLPNPLVARLRPKSKKILMPSEKTGKIPFYTRKR